ncbi:beta-lactamase family protein, partial [Glonium stellatum]
MNSDTHKTAEFDQFVQTTIEDWKVPGLAIAVIHKDEIFAKGYGLASCSGNQVTADTLFDCASISKSLTAAAVSLLVDDNEKYPDVQWNTPVSRLLREDFVLEDAYSTQNVTIEDILSHRSGMPRHDESYFGVHAAVPDNPKSITRNLRNLPLTRPLRTEYQYCNMMYTVASYMVETLSGEPFADFLNNRIWKPLGMANTYLDVPEVENNNAMSKMAKGYRWDQSTERYIEIPAIRQPEGQGAGCVFSSAEDYAKWVRAMIKRAGPISEVAHKELIKPRIITDPYGDDRMPFHSHMCYALGWGLETYRGYTIVDHDGGVSGFGSLMRYIPEKEWGIVIFGNSNGANNAEEMICWHLIDALLGTPSQEKFDYNTFLRNQEKEQREEEEKDPYPERPASALAPSAPISSYAGRYRNAGYHDLLVEIVDGKLQADAKDRTFGFTLTFEHVSGEFFEVVMLDILDDTRRRLRAEFKLNSSGVVHDLGINLAGDMQDPLIWFIRV